MNTQIDGNTGGAAAATTTDGGTAAAPGAQSTAAGAAAAAGATDAGNTNGAAAASASQTSANGQTATDAGAQAAGAQGKDGTQSQPAVPEKYDLKLPQGSQLDAHAVAEVEAYAKANKLSQESAQAGLELANKLADGRLAALQTEHATRVEQWANDVKADKEIGGDHFDRNAELARRVVTKYGDETLLKGLNESGYGNHPALVRMFVRIGKAMGEDQLVVGNQGGGKPDAASILFPNQGKTS